ncbi:MAG TPA: SMC-Scp complex subunit ScpB [Candidatus Coprosoma intestinipullorum]|uniref:Segregation and condensation protein B n=1 Tax=Candidatus Coprosoma intestinipullorum TaxID=2840752 RepID=A0A9D0ZRI8_9FIRM|nr:SMC-Scp complex subunit ScpB [Candidatus Coprosoma intestinipullorum]
MNLKAVLEGLLFVAGDDGVSASKLAEIMEIDSSEVLKLIDELSEDCKSESRGVQVKQFGDLYKFVTKEEHSKYYKKLVDEDISDSLSNSALEILAIVAYNQPITRVTIDEIRGVSCAHIVRKLVMKNLIKEVGRSELPGRPLLYGVTDQFLDYFGLKSLDDLPEIKVETESEEKELFDSKYKEE